MDAPLLCGTLGRRKFQCIFTLPLFSPCVTELMNIPHVLLPVHLLSCRAYLRSREPFLPVYVGRDVVAADAQYNWNRFATSRLPLKYQVESPVTSINQWEFEFSPSNVAPATCNEFTAMLGIGGGDTIFNRCQWSWSHGQVEYTIYSTNWDTATRNGNGRNRNQVLMWTQQDRRCCATSGRGDRVRQGFWHFETLDGTRFRLPLSGSL